VTAPTLLGQQRLVRALRKNLKELTWSVLVYLAEYDELMKLPGSGERGRKLAALANRLDVANDIAQRFGLGISFPAIKRRKRKAGE
jgi:hypothetical protein